MAWPTISSTTSSTTSTVSHTAVSGLNARQVCSSPKVYRLQQVAGLNPPMCLRSPKLCRAQRRTAISNQRGESCRLHTEEVEASLLKLVKASVEQISATETENVLDALNELRSASGGDRSPIEAPTSPPTLLVALCTQ